MALDALVRRDPEVSRLLRNTAWYGLSTAFGLGAGLLMSVVLARGLGPSRMGDYSFLMWAARTLEAVCLLGFAVATVRYTASAFGRSDPAGAAGYLLLFFRRQMVVTAVVVSAALPLVLWLAAPDLRWPFVAVVAGLFPATLSTMYANGVYGAQRYDLTTRTSVVKMAIHLAVAVAAVAAGAGVLTIVLGGVLASLVAFGLQRRDVRALYPLGAAGPVTADARQEAWRFLVSISAVRLLDVLVWDRSEVFFLRLYTASEQIAFYSLAFGLVSRAMILSEVTVGAVLPALSALHGRADAREFQRVFQATLRYAALIAAPTAALVAALAPDVVRLLYGPDYAPVALLLQLLAPVGVLDALRKVAWVALSAVGDRRAILQAMGVSAAVNLVLAAVLIRGHGTLGAVAANAAAQLLASAWVFAALARACRLRVPVGEVARALGCAGLAFLAGSAGVPGGDGGAGVLIVRAVATLAAFLAAAIALRAVDARDWTPVVTSIRRLRARGPA